MVVVSAGDFLGGCVTLWLLSLLVVSQVGVYTVVVSVTGVCI